jgi:methylated-DNA-protein-cysteine methyltransferase-like protein
MVKKQVHTSKNNSVANISHSKSVNLNSINLRMIQKISEKNTDFFEMVLEVAKLIPYGRVTSYGSIALYLGAKRSSRMVGWAMNSSHKVPGIPAHRVVNRIGLLTGKMHFGDPDQMANLLRSEGIEVLGDQIQNFQNHFWNPSEELLP